MRDALSILDQVLSFSDNQVKLDDALLVTGSVTKQLLKNTLMRRPAIKVPRPCIQ